MLIKSKSILSIIAILFVTTSLPSLVLAQDVDSSGDDWQHAILLYGWGASISGQTTFGSGGNGQGVESSDIDIGFSDLLDGVSFAFMGSYHARKNRWSILADVIYLDLSGKNQLNLFSPIGERPTDVTTEVKTGLEGLVVQLGGGYNLYHRERTTMDFIFGTRYLDVSLDVLLRFDLGLPNLNPTLSASVSKDYWDAIVGFKGNIGLGDRWYIPYYADVGAGDSDLTWQATAGVAFKAADWADIALLYHHMAWDIPGVVIKDLEFSGPALGVVFRF